MGKTISYDPKKNESKCYGFLNSGIAELKKLSDNDAVEIITWTCKEEDQDAAIVAALKKNGITIDNALYNTSTVYHSEVSSEESSPTENSTQVKDLRLLTQKSTRSLKDIIIVDDSPSCVWFQPRNAILFPKITDAYIKSKLNPDKYLAGFEKTDKEDLSRVVKLITEVLLHVDDEIDVTKELKDVTTDMDRYKFPQVNQVAVRGRFELLMEKKGMTFFDPPRKQSKVVGKKLQAAAKTPGAPSNVITQNTKLAEKRKLCIKKWTEKVAMQKDLQEAEGARKMSGSRSRKKKASRRMTYSEWKLQESNKQKQEHEPKRRLLANSVVN